MREVAGKDGLRDDVITQLNWDAFMGVVSINS